MRKERHLLAGPGRTGASPSLWTWFREVEGIRTTATASQEPTLYAIGSRKLVRVTLGNSNPTGYKENVQNSTCFYF